MADKENGMSDLVAIVYPDKEAANRARENLQAAVTQGVLEVEDVVLIAYDDDGRIYPMLGTGEVGFASVEGALGGGVIGLILLGPLLGIAGAAVGAAAAGRVTWKRRFGADVIADSFVKDLWEGLAPGTAAMIALLPEGTLEAALPHIHFQEPGTIVHSSLNSEFEAELRAAIQAAGRNP
jgi:uncharacterized membrane protein